MRGTVLTIAAINALKILEPSICDLQHRLSITAFFSLQNNVTAMADMLDNCYLDLVDIKCTVMRSAYSSWSPIRLCRLHVGLQSVCGKGLCAHLSTLKDSLCQISALKVHALQVSIAEVCAIELGVLAEGAK